MLPFSCMKRLRLFIILLYLPLQVCFSQEKDVSGIVAKPYIQSYTQGRIDLHRDTIVYKQEKVIFGVDFKFNENWSAHVGFDLIGMNRPYLKPTAITFKKDGWTIDGGIFVPSEMDLTLQFWGNRFIDRGAADKWLVGPTADLGLRVAYRWNDFISTDLSVVSGNGYQRLLEKYHPRYAFRSVITPFQSLKLGGYIAAREAEQVTETTFNGFAHLQANSKWKATGEYHLQTNSQFAEGRRLNIVSVYSTYTLLSWMSLMGRFDFLKSNKVGDSDESWNVRSDGHAFMGGLIFRCFPTVRVSVNYWNKHSSVKHIAGEDWLYVCLEFKY